MKNNKNAECHGHVKIAIKKIATLHIVHGIFLLQNTTPVFERLSFYFLP